MLITGVTISVYDRDSIKIAGALTGTNGSFLLKLNAKAQYAYATHVGYLPYKIVSFSLSPVKMHLSALGMQLAEVTVKSNRPFIEQQFDRLTVNVDGDIKSGLNAVDVLKKVPGLAVVNEFALVFEGKSVTVYLDGKPTCIIPGKVTM